MNMHSIVHASVCRPPPPTKGVVALPRLPRGRYLDLIDMNQEDKGVE